MAAPVSAPAIAGDAASTDPPSPERQEELRRLRDANLHLPVPLPPYWNVEIRTRAEVEWIISANEWSIAPVRPDQDAVDLRGCALDGADLRDMYLRYLNLSDAYLHGVNLDGAYLERAQLQHAHVRESSFKGAILEGADLSGAYFHETDFSRADLAEATLASARLARGTSLRDAILRRAHLQGAHLRRTDLCGAVLSDTSMDSATVLHEVQLDTTTRLRNIGWGGAALTNVNWNTVDWFGDEEDARNTQNARKAAAYRGVARLYRDLTSALEHQGLSTPASKFRLREQQMERKALFWNGELVPWIFSALLNVVAGYGERPLRTAATYVLVIAGFAACYLAITNHAFPFVHTETNPLSVIEALVLSITSFHGRGFSQSAPSLGDPIAVVSAAEAVIGLFVEALFVAAFSRRFLNR